MEKTKLIKLENYFILKKIRKYKQIDGWLTPNEAIGLYKIAKRLPKNSNVVEIGSWQGKSTFCMAKGLKSGSIYAIDPFNADAGFDVSNKQEYAAKKGNKNLLEVFLRNMRNFGVEKKVIPKKGYSTDFPSDFKEINFLFIDGDHSIEGCKNDFNLYANKIINGGYIAFHDYYDDRQELGPTHVINEIIKKSGDFVFYKQFDSLWIATKV